MGIDMLDPTTIALVSIVFILAGLVKGVIGLGLPTISLVLLTMAIDLPSAMSLMLVPSFATNVWQMVAGGNAITVFNRIWPFLVAAGFTVWIGAIALVRVDLDLLSGLLGMLIIIYALTGLIGFRITTMRDAELWAGPLAGVINGILTGMTGSFVVPGVIYLQSIGLARDSLVQAMGMLFTISTAALAFSMVGYGLFDAEIGMVSMLAVIPAFIGMYFGRLIRQRLPEHLFKQVFFFALLLLGLHIVI